MFLRNALRLKNACLQVSTSTLFTLLVTMMGDSVARAQVYTLSTPITGFITMSVRDSTGPAGTADGFEFQLQSLTETIYIDAIAMTIRQVGTVHGNASAHNIVINETQIIPGVFPNPPTSVNGNITVSLAPDGDILQFDTGPRPMQWDTASGVYTFDATPESLGNCSGTYSVSSGNSIFRGSFTYTLISGNWWFYYVSAFNALSTVGYPQSIGLSGLGTADQWGAMYSASPNLVADVTATNGFHATLWVGNTIFFGNSPPGERLQWTVPGTTTAHLFTGTDGPNVSTQPQSLTLHANDTATFTVTASGIQPLSYQWSLNGTNILGGTSSSLTIAHVVQEDLGRYAVVVTNTLGSATSSNATLSMYPFISVPFAGAVTYWGKPATFSLQAWGTAPLRYQWFKDGAILRNATNASVSYTSMQATNAGRYSVIVSNSFGSITNPPAQVIVYPAGVTLGFCPSVTISGQINYSYIIQRTTDLANTNSWLTLTNLTLTKPVQLWVDTSVDAISPFYSKYFYRVLPGQ